MQVLRKKYNKNFWLALRDVKIVRPAEQRLLQPKTELGLQMPALTKQDEPRPVSTKYSITHQEESTSYPVKWEVDLSDPSSWSDCPPQTTAKAWTVYDMNKCIRVQGKNEDLPLEIASMTKIMTMYTCLKIMQGDMECMEIDPKKVYFRAS